MSSVWRPEMMVLGPTTVEAFNDRRAIVVRGLFAAGGGSGGRGSWGPARSGANRESAGTSGWLIVLMSGSAGFSDRDGGSSVFSEVNGSPAWSESTSEV